jgi:hypothetical protein
MAREFISNRYKKDEDWEDPNEYIYTGEYENGRKVSMMRKDWKKLQEQ